jgi:hypothetical protein
VVGACGTSRLADLGDAATALAARIGAGERGPFCVVTHHRRHDDDVWAFCEAFWSTLRGTGRLEMLAARDIFQPR